jgi:hypothetical protein
MSIDLFTLPAQTNVGIKVPTTWRLVKDGITKNVQTLKDYWQSAAPPVSAVHPLVRMLDSFQASPHQDPQPYIDEIRDNVLRYASQQSMTTAVSPGRAFTGVFYDAGITELLIGGEGAFEIEAELSSWKDIQAVKVLLHPKSDLKLQLMNAKPYSNETGLACVYINIPLLALQHWAFLNDPVSQECGTQGFLARFVLPNMLPSHVEIAWLNRLFLDHYGVPRDTVEIDYRHKVALPDYSLMIEGLSEQVRRNLTLGNKRFDHLLQNIPSFYSKDMHDALHMPDVTTTQQDQWALLACRNRYLSYLCDVAGEHTGSINMGYATDLRDRVSIYTCLPALKKALPPPLYIEQESYLANLYESILGREL